MSIIDSINNSVAGFANNQLPSVGSTATKQTAPTNPITESQAYMAPIGTSGQTKPVTIVNADKAKENYNTIKTSLGVIDQGITQQNLTKATNAVNAAQTDPIIQAAMSAVGADELLKSNPQAAYYRAFGKKAPDMATLNTFVAGQNPTVSAVKEATDILKKAEGITDTKTDTTISAAQTEIDKRNAEDDTRFAQMEADRQAMLNGTLPLSPDQLAQIESLRQQYEQLKRQQAIYNQNYEGGTQIASIVSGRNRYAPELAMGQLMAAQSAGVAKIADLDSRMNNAVATLREGFRSSNYKLIQEAYTDYNNYQKQKKDALQKQIDDAKKAATDLKKWNYDTIEKPKNDILTDLAANNAPGSIITAASNAKTLAEAIAASGDWLQTGTGVIGEYLQEKRDSLAAGREPLDYASWTKKREADAFALKNKEAYSSAYNAAAGRLAAENKIGSTKLLSIADAKALGVPYGTTEAEAIKLQKTPGEAAKKDTTKLQQKVTLIDSLIASPGLDSRVGPNAASRRAFEVVDKFGAGQEFAGGVHQLVSQDTLDTLINLKSQGGTLGALSDQERLMLQNAATKIADWEVKENGIGIGEWNVAESTFKKELESLKALANKAIEAAGSADFTKEEETQLLNDFAPAFDPSKY